MQKSIAATVVVVLSSICTTPTGTATNMVSTIPLNLPIGVRMDKLINVLKQQTAQPAATQISISPKTPGVRFTITMETTADTMNKTQMNAMMKVMKQSIAAPVMVVHISKMTLLTAFGTANRVLSKVLNLKIGLLVNVPNHQTVAASAATQISHLTGLKFSMPMETTA